MLRRVRSGIPGFDDIVGGGLIKGRTYMILGGPGAGKTIFALQFLHTGAAEYGERGVYVTLEESVDSIMHTARQFGWDLAKLKQEEKIEIVDASPFYSPLATSMFAVKSPGVLGEREFDMMTLITLVKQACSRVNAERIVIDSLTPLILQYRELFEARMQILQLTKTLSELEGATSLIVAELTSPTAEATLFGIEPYVVDGVILLYNIRSRAERIRAIEVLKMRGSPHSNMLHPFQITKDGIVVYPKEKVFEGGA